MAPHGLPKLLLREPGVCRVDVLALVELAKERLANASLVIEACEECQAGRAEGPARGAEALLHELRSLSLVCWRSILASSISSGYSGDQMSVSLTCKSALGAALRDLTRRDTATSHRPTCKSHRDAEL